MKYSFCHLISPLYSFVVTHLLLRGLWGARKLAILWSGTWTKVLLPINYIWSVYRKISSSWVLQNVAGLKCPHYRKEFIHQTCGNPNEDVMDYSGLGREVCLFTVSNNAEMFFPCPFTLTMCHSVPHKHLIYSNSLAWPVIPPSPYPSDPSVFHFPLISIQRARPRPCLEPLDRDWHCSLFLHHILCWKKWPSDQRTEPALSPATKIWKHFQSFALYTHSNALMWSTLGLLWAFFPANSLLTFQACTSLKTRLRQGPEYSIGKSPRARA